MLADAMPAPLSTMAQLAEASAAVVTNRFIPFSFQFVNGATGHNERIAAEMRAFPLPGNP
ncbi:hypothetical protein Stsp01_09380 [Streptomyces sp. NBRC 13847]|nr:hypothetical protein Stsp01_09380 [Streptomyces sp. NBRC 13847]